MSLVDGERWRTLGDVLETAQEISEPNGDLPLSAGNNMTLSVESLTVAGLTEGTWYFAIKTVETNGFVSDWPVSASKTISR